MARQRNPPRAVLLSDDESSRLLLRAQCFADAGSIGATSPTAAAAPPEVTVAPTKTRKKLGTAFRCPVCKRAESVECRIDTKRKVAEASCCCCEASYSAAAADPLTEPIDVYCEWVDERRRAAGVRRDHDGDVMMADA